MKKNFGKFLTVILLLVLISTTAPANVFAAENTNAGEFTYTQIVAPQY